MAKLPFGISRRRRASLSRTSLQSLSTRHGRLGSFSKVHSPQSSILTQGGVKGPLTSTLQVLLMLSARSSVTVPVIAMVFPASAAYTVRVADAPCSLSWPPVEAQLYVRGR